MGEERNEELGGLNLSGTDLDTAPLQLRLISLELHTAPELDALAAV